MEFSPFVIQESNKEEIPISFSNMDETNRYEARIVNGELVALVEYKAMDGVVHVRVAHIEESQYLGIERVLVAFGIKLSADSGFNGDVTFETGVSELPGAIQISSYENVSPRYCISGKVAMSIFETYLKKGTDLMNPSDIEKYFKQAEDSRADRYYEIFFSVCRKFNISWTSGSPKEKAFAEEVARVTFEREEAIAKGLPLSTVRPFFG